MAAKEAVKISYIKQFSQQYTRVNKDIKKFERFRVGNKDLKSISPVIYELPKLREL